MKPMEMLKEFHTVYEISNDISQKELRLKLITEEYEEVKEIIGKAEEYIDWDRILDKEKLAKELSDLLYVVYGTAFVFGIDLETALREVHRSNMSKLGPDGKPIRRSDGKVLKGEFYVEPDMSCAIL